jgi:hypothetical protein
MGADEGWEQWGQYNAEVLLCARVLDITRPRDEGCERWGQTRAAGDGGRRGLEAMGVGAHPVFARGGMMVYNAARWCGAGKRHHGSPGEVPEWTIGAAC